MRPQCPTINFRDAAGAGESVKEARTSERSSRAGLDMWYECESEGGAATVAALEKMSALTAHDDKLGAAVSAAEAELKISLFAAASNDPMLDSQHHYDVANLFGAWNHTTGSPDVVVQVLDTGIDTNHPDLQQNIWQNPGEICGNGIDDDGNGYVDDCNGYNHADDTGNDLLGGHWHGSHCGGAVSEVID